MAHNARPNHDGRPHKKRVKSTVARGESASKVQRRERLNGRTYLLLERLAPEPRERWLVRDPASGGQHRTMLILPSENSVAQRIKVLRRVESNATPKILDLDQGPNQTRIVMPWVKGMTLTDYLAQVEKPTIDPPEPHQAIRLAFELALGLRSMHKFAEVIHGDIKPDNLIVTRKSSHLRMIDFGSAWPIGMTGVRIESDGMTPIFAAPELKTEGVGDERADQFSASLVLYQMLTGKIAYSGIGGKAGWPEWYDADNVAVAPSTYPMSSKYLPRKLWQEIDEVVLKGIELDPGQRYSQSAAWCDAIERVHLKLRLHRQTDHNIESTWDRACAWLGAKLTASRDK